MKSLTILIGVSVVALLAVMTGYSQQTSQLQVEEGREIKEDAKGFMRIKLKHTKDIVEGLALENFDAIGDGAQRLILLSHESNWTTFQSEKYLDMSEEFRDSANRLRTAAKEKNLDGATLAYFEVTLNCVRCHKQVRKIRHDLSKQKK